MSLSETFTAIGDAIRRQYGTTDKYSLGDMPKMIDYLEVRNFLAGNSFEATFQNGWVSKDLTGPDMDTWNKYIAGKTVTFSCDAEWTGYEPVEAKYGNRFFFEFATTTTDDQSHWNGLYFTPTTKEGKQHLTNTVKISDLPVKSINNIKFWDELNEGSHLKVTNIKMTINPVGGVINPNLIADWANNLIDSRVSLSDGILSFNNPNGGSSQADFYTINGGIKLTPGHTYRLSYRVRGTGYVRTYIYAYNDKETGDYVDNGHTVQLENSWQTVIYTFKYNPAVDNPSLAFAFRPGNADQDTRASKGEAADFCLVDISQ